jgi:hypothetical protein
VDASGVYFTDNTGSVFRVALSGGAAVQIASGQSSPLAIALDDTAVYWINTGTSTIMKVAK